MSSFRAAMAIGATALFGSALAADGAVLAWADHAASITAPAATPGLNPGQSTGAMADFTINNIDNSGVNATVKTTLGANSMYVSSTPGVRTEQIATGGYGVYVETLTAVRDTENPLSASATVEITFSQPVENVSFIYAGLRDIGPRHQQITFFADGSDEGISLSLYEETSLQLFASNQDGPINGARGVAGLSSGSDTKGVVMVALEGPVTTLSYTIENIPETGFGGMGAAIGDITFSAVPEPSVVSLLGLGGLALLRRRAMTA